MQIKFISTKQECPYCKSTDVMIEGINNFFCKTCGKNGIIRPQSKLTPRLAFRNIKKNEPRIKDRVKKFFTKTSPTACPFCRRNMKKVESIYQCKCGAWAGADEMEEDVFTEEPSNDEDNETEDSYIDQPITRSQDTFNSIIKIDKHEFQNMRCPRCNEMSFSVVKVKEGKSKFKQCIKCAFFEQLSQKEKNDLNVMETKENGK